MAISAWPVRIVLRTSDQTAPAQPGGSDSAACIISSTSDGSAITTSIKPSFASICCRLSVNRTRLWSGWSYTGSFTTCLHAKQLSSLSKSAEEELRRSLHGTASQETSKRVPRLSGAAAVCEQCTKQPKPVYISAQPPELINSAHTGAVE